VPAYCTNFELQPLGPQGMVLWAVDLYHSEHRKTKQLPVYGGCCIFPRMWLLEGEGSGSWQDYRNHLEGNPWCGHVVSKPEEPSLVDCLLTVAIFLFSALDHWKLGQEQVGIWDVGDVCLALRIGIASLWY